MQIHWFEKEREGERASGRTEGREKKMSRVEAQYSVLGREAGKMSKQKRNIPFAKLNIYFIIFSVSRFVSLSLLVRSCDAFIFCLCCFLQSSRKKADQMMFFRCKYISLIENAVISLSVSVVSHHTENILNCHKKKLWCSSRALVASAFTICACKRFHIPRGSAYQHEYKIINYYFVVVLWHCCRIAHIYGQKWPIQFLLL